MGAGLTGSKGVNHGSLKVFDHADFAHAEADVGFGPSIGASTQMNKSSSSTSDGLPVPKIDVGVGAYAGAGYGCGFTVATPANCGT